MARLDEIAASVRKLVAFEASRPADQIEIDRDRSRSRLSAAWPGGEFWSLELAFGSGPAAERQERVLRRDLPGRLGEGASDLTGMIDPESGRLFSLGRARTR